jgi:hypothetical protein
VRVRVRVRVREKVRERIRVRARERVRESENKSECKRKGQGRGEGESQRQYEGVAGEVRVCVPTGMYMASIMTASGSSMQSILFHNSTIGVALWKEEN